MANASTTPRFDLKPPSPAQLRRLIDGLDEEERRVMLHYCINSVALRFTPKGERLPDSLFRGTPEGEVWTG